MLFSKEDIDKVLSRSEDGLLEIIGEFGELRRSGASWTTACLKTMITENYKLFCRGLELFGIKPLSDDTSARILAIIYVYGGDREEFVFNGSLKTDLDYASRRANIGGGLIPDPGMSTMIRDYIDELERYDKNHPYTGPACCGRVYPDWVKELMFNKYGIKL